MQPGSSGTSATNARSSSLQKIMISYRFPTTLFLCQMILQDYCPNLSHLIRLRVRSFALKIDLFFDTCLREHVMTASSAFDEAEGVKNTPNVFEGDVG